MPEMDGVNATKHIRQLSDLPQPPIVALTASTLAEDHARCLEAGMNEYVFVHVCVGGVCKFIKLIL